MNLTFFIPGIPKPGGSKTGWVPRRKDGSIVTRPNGAPVVVIMDSGKKANKEWKQQCSVFASQAYKGPPMTGPLRVRMHFFRTRPQDHFRSNGALKDWAVNERPVTKPDVLKLTRAVEDALSGIIWVDDAQIVDEVMSKSYGDRPGCEVTVQTLEETMVAPLSTIDVSTPKQQPLIA